LFASGPSEIEVGAWERNLVRRSFAGVGGELVLDLGRRSRLLTQSGRLQAASAAALADLITAIEGKADEQTHTLVDACGQTYPNVILERFAPEGAIEQNRDVLCDYRLTWRQLP
jgi:hypothetical protein